MAKDKGSKTKTEDGAGSNGAILFEVMPEGFQPPVKAAHGQWDAIVTKLCSKEHLKDYPDRFVTLFRSAIDDPDACNTRAKGVRKAAKRLGLKVIVTVRKLEDHNALLVKGELGTPKVQE